MSWQVADAHDMSRVDFQRSVRKHAAHLSLSEPSQASGAGSVASCAGASLTAGGGASVATVGTRLLAMPEPPAAGVMGRFGATPGNRDAHRTHTRLGNSSSSSNGGVSDGDGGRGMGRHAAAVLGDASGFGDGRPEGAPAPPNNAQAAPAPEAAAAASSGASSGAADAAEAAGRGGGVKGRRKGKPKPAPQDQSAARRKKPCSSSSLLACLLDLEYGPTDAKAIHRLPPATGGAQSHNYAGWDTAAFL